MKYLIYSGIFMFLFITSCEKDEPTPPNDEELITTVRLEFVDQNSNETKIFQFQDLDGDGGNAPIYTTDTLSNNTSYLCFLYLLNESETPAESINSEIEAEGADHQFFFLKENGLNLNITYNDLDENQNPIGLINYASTLATSQGELTVILRHQGDKFATGASAGDITNVGGSTDVEVSFNVIIE